MEDLTSRVYTPKEIESLFTWRDPDQQNQQKCNELRSLAIQYANAINEAVPPGNAKLLAITNVQTSLWESVQAITGHAAGGQTRRTA